MTSSASSAVTRILNAIAADDPRAADELLPLVYDELRKLAAQRMAHESPAQTLQPTALVHEAYLRLVGGGAVQWTSRGHFFAAAAQAMRRILVERARRRGRIKHGGDRERLPLGVVHIASPEERGDDVVALDEALRKLEAQDRVRSDVVKLRYFAGLTVDQTAEVLEIAPATVKRYWTYAQAWLCHEMTRGEDAAT